MALGQILVAGQRMADQHGVAAGGVEGAVGPIGDVNAWQALAAIQLERLRETGVLVLGRRQDVRPRAGWNVHALLYGDAALARQPAALPRQGLPGP